MPSFLEYVEKTGVLPTCLTMSFAAYVAFFSSDIQELNEKGLVCRRPKGDCYTCQDDRWVLEFYWDHRADTPAELVHAVMTNEQMWGRDSDPQERLCLHRTADRTDRRQNRRRGPE